MLGNSTKLASSGPVAAPAVLNSVVIPILFMRSRTLACTHAAIVERGAKNERAPQLTAKMPDHELWAAFVRDPDGNLIGLMEEKR